MAEEQDAGQGLTLVQGRGRNNLSDVYKLPADATEMERLALQHRMWKLLVGGLYPPELSGTVEQVTKADHGHRPRILDVGSGSGSWTIDIAQAIPHAEVIGVDLVRNAAVEPPKNCRFMIGDLTKGLSEFQGSSDMVHSRSVIGHLLDPVAGLRIIVGCLKPGALLLYADGDLRLYDAQKRPLAAAVEGEDNTGRSWFAQWMQEWAKLTCPDGYYSMEDRVASLKRDSRIDLDSVVHRQYFAPVNWSGEEVEDGEEIGQIMKANSVQFVHACKPSFLAQGYDPETVERWISDVEKEIEGPTVRLYTTWHLVSAFMKQNK